jgi:hypothetical protein
VSSLREQLPGRFPTEFEHTHIISCIYLMLFANRKHDLVSSIFTTRPLTETDYDRWTALVSAAPSGSIFALPAYLEILCGATEGRFEIVGVFHGDELVGGMPLYFRPGRLGEVASQRSLLSYHGPVIREYGTHNPAERTSRHLKILAALVKALRQVPCQHMTLQVRHPITDVRPFQAAGWHVQPRYSYLVEFADLAETWARMDQNQRRLIQRAQTQGLTVTTDDDFESFFRLHWQIHLRKHAPLYLPKEIFRIYLQRLLAQDLAQLYHARLPDGRSVATQLVLTGPHSITHTVCAASDEAHLTTGANPFLRWMAFSALANLGYSGTDLTGAPYPHQVTRFKSQLGGELVTNWAITRPPTGRYWWWQKSSSLIRLIRKKIRINVNVIRHLLEEFR